MLPRAEGCAGVTSCNHHPHSEVCAGPPAQVTAEQGWTREALESIFILEVHFLGQRLSVDLPKEKTLYAAAGDLTCLMVTDLAVSGCISRSSPTHEGGER